MEVTYYCFLIIFHKSITLPVYYPHLLKILLFYGALSILTFLLIACDVIQFQRSVAYYCSSFIMQFFDVSIFTFYFSIKITPIKKVYKFKIIDWSNEIKSRKI